MLETGYTGLALMLGFSALFRALHFVVLPITKLYDQGLYLYLVKERKHFLWRNIAISYTHAVVCVLFISYCLATSARAIHEDLMHADIYAARILLCLSCGYFLADVIDLIYTGRLSFDLVSHHVVVLACYGLAIYYGMFAPYLMGTLFVEFSNVFLHQRRLFLIAGGEKSTEFGFYMINLLLLLGTYPLFRFFAHGWLIWRVVQDQPFFPEPWMFYTAFMGMLAMNILNVALLIMLVNGDRDILTKFSKEVKQKMLPSRSGKSVQKTSVTTQTLQKDTTAGNGTAAQGPFTTENGVKAKPGIGETEVTKRQPVNALNNGTCRSEAALRVTEEALARSLPETLCN